MWDVILADTFLMLHRLIQRFVSVARISGWYQAFLSIPRAVVGNAINFVATAMATKQFFVRGTLGQTGGMEKDGPCFPFRGATHGTSQALG